MIFEYRQYTLKSGCTGAFWEAQVARGFDPVRPILDRLVGYFEAASGPHDQITHLYYFYSFDDWKTRLHGLYADTSLTTYFHTVRQLMTAQENKFLVRAPLESLNPIIIGEEWALSGAAVSRPCANLPVLVEETTTQLLPGALSVFWDAYERCLAFGGPLITRHLLGCFSTLVGPLHQVIHYRTYADYTAREAHAADLRRSTAWQQFIEVVGPLTLREDRKLLRPSPLPELSPLFEPRVARTGASK